jgi:hypothetical protein
LALLPPEAYSHEYQGRDHLLSCVRAQNVAPRGGSALLQGGGGQESSEERVPKHNAVLSRFLIKQTECYTPVDAFAKLAEAGWSGDCPEPGPQVTERRGARAP